MSAILAPSCSSPTTRRRSGSARSRRCTSARTSSSRWSAAACATAAAAGEPSLPFPAVLPAAARDRAARRVGTLPRRGRRARRAASRCPAAYAGARRAGSRSCCGRRSGRIRAPPRTRSSYLPLRHLYRHADAIVTYGPHVVGLRALQGRARPGRRGAAERRRRVLERARVGTQTGRPFQVAFVGRLAREKGVAVLLRAWRASGLSAPHAALVLVGGGPFRARAAATGAVLPGELPPVELRNFYAGSDVVVVPSVPTRDFREPWGLVVNEAFDQGVPVIASDAVGAAAGGLVRHERDRARRPRRGRRRAGRRAAPAARRRRRCAPASAPPRARPCAPYDHDAWAAGMSRALAAVGASRRPGAASVASPMRRLMLAVVALTLLVAPPAEASTVNDVIRDCSKNGKLPHDYPPSLIREGAREPAGGHRRVHRLPRPALDAELQREPGRRRQRRRWRRRDRDGHRRRLHRRGRRLLAVGLEHAGAGPCAAQRRGAQVARRREGRRRGRAGPRRRDAGDPRDRRHDRPAPSTTACRAPCSSC